MVFAVHPNAERADHAHAPDQQRRRKRRFSDDQLSEYMAAGLALYPTGVQRLLREIRAPYSTRKEVERQTTHTLLALANHMPFIASLPDKERLDASWELVADFIDAVRECVRSDNGVEDPTQI
ncbi:hypothetical protein BKP54_25430 [Ensifer sp. 1H6]|nr:hypothetical protein BKP54_25430 [Ensifer sp. 1H6]